MRLVSSNRRHQPDDLKISILEYIRRILTQSLRYCGCVAILSAVTFDGGYRICRSTRMFMIKKFACWGISVYSKKFTIKDLTDIHKTQLWEKLKLVQNTMVRVTRDVKLQSGDNSRVLRNTSDGYFTIVFPLSSSHSDDEGMLGSFDQYSPWSNISNLSFALYLPIPGQRSNVLRWRKICSLGC